MRISRIHRRVLVIRLMCDAYQDYLMLLSFHLPSLLIFFTSFYLKRKICILFQSITCNIPHGYNGYNCRYIKQFLWILEFLWILDYYGFTSRKFYLFLLFLFLYLICIIYTFVLFHIFYLLSVFIFFYFFIFLEFE